MLKYKIVSFSLIIALCCFITSYAQAQLTVAHDGKSTFTIIIPADAPSSVQAAAQELQKNIEIATGAKLLLQDDAVAAPSNYISLGATSQAKNSDVTTTGIGDAGFRILTRSGNLYIIGPDTADGAWTKDGGVSNGTANGVYTFLEEYLDVRWLMPGDIGRDVPKKSTFTIPHIDRNETPKFMYREMIFIDRALFGEHREKAQAWGNRQKLGSSIELNHGHNWIETVSPDLYKEHPDWFAMKNGKRVAPTGIHYKLETTNPEVVRFFADKAIEALKSSKKPTTFSLSPSDGRNWSESPESVALYDPSPSNLFDPEAPPGFPSMSSLILKWYHDVAKIVEKEYPQGKLAGYIYADYVYPPTKVDMKLPDNFTPMLCGIGTYGYGLYRAPHRERWLNILNAWAKVAPEDWFYYDLPNQFLRQDGMPTAGNFSGNVANLAPPAPDMLNFIFHNLVRVKMKGALIYGDQSWSSSALANYLIAKLMWNPELDANELQREWLQRAYGSESGAVMEQFYSKLNSFTQAYYNTHTDVSYRLTPGMLRDIYAAHYGELEQLFLQAKAQPATPIQKERLELVENNLIVLQWRLRNAKFLEAGFKSDLQRTDSEVADFIESQHPDIDYFPQVIPSGKSRFDPSIRTLEVKKVTLEKNLAPPKDELRISKPTTYLLYAAKNSNVRITPRMVDHATMFATYYILGRRQGRVASGVLVEGRTIEFNARAGEDYYFYIPARANVGYELFIADAVVAKSTFDRKSGTVSLRDQNAALYVYPDKDVAAVTNGAVIATAPTLETVQQRFTSVKMMNLDKEWKFYPDALESEEVRAYRPEHNDSSWKTIHAGDWWQNQGFPDYRGQAWYRKTFTIPELAEGEQAILHFTEVDGTAVSFLNGKGLGAHKVGSDFVGWDEPFFFDVTKLLRPGKNTLAVRVHSKSPDTASGIHGSVNLLIGKPR